jgi:Rrf2 family protein
MRLSIKTIYGLQALFELALNYGSGEIKIGDIAKAQKIPPRFLEQILLILKRKGILESSRGAKGGYSLARPPREIALLEVVQALEGPLVFASIKKASDIRQPLDKIKETVELSFKEMSLEDFIYLKQQKDSSFNYTI